MKKIISNRGKWEDLTLKQRNIYAKGNSHVISMVKEHKDETPL